MKTLLMRFSDSILSNNELKNLKGGYPYSGGGGAQCKEGCGCKHWPAVSLQLCHCTVENWWGNSQGKECQV